MEERQVPDGQIWFIRKHSVVAGPFPCGMIRRFVLLGRLNENSEVSPDRENWYRLGGIERLVPEEMRHLETDEDYQRLELARRREDERRTDRRQDAAAEPDAERRRQSDRRQPESEDDVKRRLARARNVPEMHPPRPLLAYALVGVLVAGLALIGAYVWMSTPEESESVRNCSAAVAPGVDWSNCSLEGIRLSGAELQGARIENADLHSAELQGAQLTRAQLSYSNLGAADLRFADLRDAVLMGTGLRGADLRDARLDGADLSYADLRGARLEGASLEQAQLGKALWVDGRVCAPESIGACN